MIKTYTVGGCAAFRITIKTIFTLDNALTALGEFKYDHNGDVNFDEMTKTKGKAIIINRIIQHGRNGKWEAFSGDGIGDNQDELNRYYEEAKAWVIKNYPYLATNR